MKKTGILLIGLISLAFTAITTVELQVPAHFPKPQYDFSKNPLTSKKIELGRLLFYDPLLSKNNTISCASCHSPFNSFAHTDHDLSHGINDSIGTRNAPALFNLAWQKQFMWDGAIHHLDVQALAPISHPAEMGESIEHVVQKLQNDEQYPELFLNAFGSSTITGEHVLKAISQFQLTLVSADSKYDHVKMNKDSFTIQEANGHKLFKQHCNSCHTEPLFSSYKFANNGLSVDTTLNDFGRWIITKQSQDSLQFKIPSLRNLSFTYPYMHDGRFHKLSEVLNHYSDIQPSPQLSQELRHPIALSSNEKVDIIAFLLTLNDKNFVFDKKHLFPKK